MSGTRIGGKAAAATNKAKYGPDFYAKIGAAGGKNGNTGGFASNKVGADGLTGKERASKVGIIGGHIGKRNKWVELERRSRLSGKIMEPTTVHKSFLHPFRKAI